MKRISLPVLFLIFLCTSVTQLLAQPAARPAVKKDKAAGLVQKPSENILTLSRSGLSKGEILLLNSSHQDLAWMDFLEKCIIERDTMLMTPLLKAAKNDPGYRFDIEDVLMIKEYLGRHPDSKPVIVRMLRDGRLTCGSTYQMPYEEMYSGESLVRQFYLGARWVRENLEGYFPDTYWNPDVPGRSMQMAQIMYKSGTRNLVMSRHEKGVYRWYSPDNSFVYAYSPGHYAEDFLYLGKDFPEASDVLAQKAMYWTGAYNDKPGSTPVIPALSDWDMSPAKDYSGLISRWNSMKGYKDASGKVVALNLPPIRLATTPEFIKKISGSTSELKKITGERPAVWLYIHGPSHEWALKASREGDIMMTVAEKFSTIYALLQGTFKKYPEEQLNKAWESKIYPDHGWGGKGGESTDAIFLRKFEESLDKARSLTGEALNGIASMIETDPEKGIPVVVFNSLSWKRSDPVTFKMGFDQGRVFNIKMIDFSGKEIPVQINNVLRYNDNSLKRIDAVFIAEEVPSVGYKTFYVLSDKDITSQPVRIDNIVETPFYRVEFRDGGVKSIFDKEMNAELLKTGKISGGDVFTLKSVGNGAGEFADIQKTEMEGFDIVSAHSPEWKVTGDGPVYTALTIRQPVKNAVVESTVKIYRNIKKIDFDVALLNWEGLLYREYRFALPLNIEKGQVSYEVPFGVLEVGKDEIAGAAGERYLTNCSDVHPRGVENWIGASGDRFGVTMSTTTAVADYVDPTGLAGGALMLQAIMLASRRSCHGEGNEYLQTGNHYFSFSLTSHKPGFSNGYQFGRQANEMLLAVVDPYFSDNVFLPGEASFFSTDRPNVSISAIKKAEGENATVLRLFETGSGDTPVRLDSWFTIKGAATTSMIEYDDKAIEFSPRSVPFNLGSHSVETFKLDLTK